MKGRNPHAPQRRALYLSQPASAAGTGQRSNLGWAPGDTRGTKPVNSATDVTGASSSFLSPPPHQPLSRIPMSYKRVRDRSPPPLPPPITSDSRGGYPPFTSAATSSSFVSAPPQLGYLNRGHRSNQDGLEVPLLSPTRGPNHSGFGIRGFTGRGPEPPYSSSNPSSGQITPSAELLRPPLDGTSDFESVGKLVDSQHGYASLGTVSLSELVLCPTRPYLFGQQSAFKPAITEKVRFKIRCLAPRNNPSKYLPLSLVRAIRRSQSVGYRNSP